MCCEAGVEVLWGLNEAQLFVLGWTALALLVGLGCVLWFWWQLRRERRLEAERVARAERAERERQAGRPRIARPTGAWAFPMPPPAAKKYVPPVNGTVRVHPGGMVARSAPERWDLYVPPAPVDIPVIPPAPGVPDIEEYRGHGGRFGGAGAIESWPEVERHDVGTTLESGVREVGSVDTTSGGSDVGGSFDGSVGGGGPD